MTLALQIEMEIASRITNTSVCAADYKTSVIDGR